MHTQTHTGTIQTLSTQIAQDKNTLADTFCCSHATLEFCVLWCTWSPVGADLAVIQLLTGPSLSVSAASPHTGARPSINHSEALFLYLHCCLGIPRTFPFPPFPPSCSKIELPFVCLDFLVIEISFFK